MIDNGHFNNWTKEAKDERLLRGGREKAKRQSLWSQKQFSMQCSQPLKIHYCPYNQAATHLKHSHACSQHQELCIPLSSESGL